MNIRNMDDESMGNKVYEPDSINKTLKELLGEDPSDWGIDFIRKLEKLTEDVYDDIDFDKVVRLLKENLTKSIDNAVIGMYAYDAWIDGEADRLRGK